MSSPTLPSIAPCGMPWPQLDTWVNQLAITPDSKILAASCIDRTIHIWNAENSQPIGSPLKGHTNSVRCLSASPNSYRLMSGGDEGTIRLWDLENPGDSIKVWNSVHKGAVRSIAFSADGKLAASSGDDGTVRLWDIVSSEPVGTPMKHHQFPVSCLAFNSTGSFLASGDEEGCLVIWSVQQSSLKIRSRVQIPRSVPIAGIVALSHIDHVVTACSDMTVRRWDLASGAAVGSSWKEHTDSVRCIGILQDKILTGGSDSTLRLWDPANGSQIGDAWKGPEGSVETLAIAPSGKFAISAGASEMWTWMFS